MRRQDEPAGIQDGSTQGEEKLLRVEPPRG